MLSCIVYGCPNNTLTNADSSVHYYIFPKHPLVSQQWVQACGWGNQQIDVNSARICSVHFDDNSYSNEIKVIDYIACYTKVLKYDAIPTLYLPNHVVVKNVNHESGIKEMMLFSAPTQQNNVNQSNEGNEYIELQVQPSTSENFKLPDQPLPSIKETFDISKYKHVQTRGELRNLQKENAKLRYKILQKETVFKSQKAIFYKKISTYKQKDLQLQKLKQEYMKYRNSSLSLADQQVLLAKVFSDSQIKILSGKKKIYWNDNDMAVGYTIRHLSNKMCYQYLTKKLNIPLPAVSSIKRWMTLKNATAKKRVEIKKDQEESE